MAERHGGGIKIVAECEIRETEVEVWEEEEHPWLAPSGRIHLERTDGEALRVIHPHVLSFVGVAIEGPIRLSHVLWFHCPMYSNRSGPLDGTCILGGNSYNYTGEVVGMISLYSETSLSGHSVRRPPLYRGHLCKSPMLLYLYIFTSVKRPPHYKGQFYMALCDRYKEVSLYKLSVTRVRHRTSDGISLPSPPSS